MMWLLVLSVLVPIALLASISLGSVSSYLMEESVQGLRQEAKSLAMSLLDRLELLERELTQLEDPRFRSHLESLDRSSFSETGTGRCGGETSATPVTSRVHLTPEQCERLEQRQPVLLVEPGEIRSELLLVHPVGGDEWIWGRVRPEAIWQRASTVPPRVGVVVLTVDGRHLLGTEQAPGPVREEVLSRGLSASADSFSWEDESGSYVTALWGIPMRGNYGAGDWIVSLHLPSETALSSVRRFRFYFPLVVGLTLLSALLVGSVLLRRTLSPVHELARATHALGRGDFEVELPEPTGNEIGELTTAFRRMANQLRHQFTTLTATAQIGKEVAQGGERSFSIFFSAAEDLLPWQTARLELAIEPGSVRWRRGVGFVDLGAGDDEGYPRTLRLRSREEDGPAATLTLWGPEPVSGERIELLQGLLNQLVAAAHRVHLSQVLETERAHLATLLDQLPYGVLVLDRGGFIEFANPLGQVHLADLERAEGSPTRVRALGGRTVDELCQSEAWHEVATDAEPSRVFIVVARNLEPHSEAHRSLVVLRDVTDEKMVERQLHQQERLAAVGQLAAGMAHDLNNMLQGIGLCGDLLGRAIAPENRPDLEILLDFQRRAARLLQQVLDFSRRSESQQRPVALAAELQELVSLLQRTLPSAIELRFEPDPETDHVLVAADPVQLHQVVANLVLNARDAMPSGGTIVIGLERGEPIPPTERDTVCLSVSDSGEGIPFDIQARVFDPFFTTKPTGEGTGLGLSQVYGIVAEHEGTVDLASTPGQGTTVRLTFPTVSEKAVNETSDDLDHRPSHNHRVLVVEDELLLLELLRRHLEDLGHSVATATNGSEAISWLEDHPAPGVVLCDVMMPQKGGDEVLREVRERSIATRVVLMSGNPADRTPSAELEPDAWLRKPFQLKELEAAIDRVLSSG